MGRLRGGAEGDLEAVGSEFADVVGDLAADVALAVVAVVSVLALEPLHLRAALTLRVRVPRS
jgi:hypothetical protein